MPSRKTTPRKVLAPAPQALPLVVKEQYSPPPITRRRFLESIDDGGPKPQTAVDKLKAAICEVLSSDRRASIELGEIRRLVGNAKGPSDRESQEAQQFDNFVASLKDILDGKVELPAGDEDLAKSNAIAKLVDYSAPLKESRYSGSWRKLKESRFSAEVQGVSTASDAASFAASILC